MRQYLCLEIPGSLTCPDIIPTAQGPTTRPRSQWALEEAPVQGLGFRPPGPGNETSPRRLPPGRLAPWRSDSTPEGRSSLGCTLSAHEAALQLPLQPPRMGQVTLRMEVPSAGARPPPGLSEAPMDEAAAPFDPERCVIDQ